MKVCICILLLRIFDYTNLVACSTLKETKCGVDESPNQQRLEKTSYETIIDDHKIPGLKTNEIDTKQENKREITVTIRTRDKEDQDEATTIETSKQNESNSQQLRNLNLHKNMEDKSLDHSVKLQSEFHRHPYEIQYTEEMSYRSPKTEKNLEIIDRLEMRRKLVEGILAEESTGRLLVAEATAKPELRLETTSSDEFQIKPLIENKAITLRTLRWLNDMDLKTRIAPSMPNEQLSIAVFDNTRRKRQVHLTESETIATQHWFKYMAKRRSLSEKLNKLKVTGAYTHYSKINVTTNVTLSPLGDKEKNDKREGEDKMREDRNGGKKLTNNKRTKHFKRSRQKSVTQIKSTPTIKRRFKDNIKKRRNLAIKPYKAFNVNKFESKYFTLIK